MQVNTDNLSTRKTSKDQVSMDVKALVPNACKIGIGNKQKIFFNYLAKRLEANDPKVIDQLCFMMGELAARGNMAVHCSCNCKNQHAEAIVAFMKEYKDAIEMFYKVSKHHMTTMSGNGMTLETCGLPLDQINQIKALMAQDMGQQPATPAVEAETTEIIDVEYTEVSEPGSTVDVTTESTSNT